MKITKTAIRKSMAFYGMNRGEFERAIADGHMFGFPEKGEPPIVIIEKWLADQKSCVRCGNQPIREVLDGDLLCQSCCTKWARGEGQALADRGSDAASALSLEEAA